MVARNTSENLFETAYQHWLEKHIKNSNGERKRRLANGLGHAEKIFLKEVWWPAFGNLEHLHPEYEVNDFKDGSRFLDFAYIQPGLKLCIEIDPFGTHYSKISRWQYDDNLDRHNDLMIDDWKILRFSKDKLTDNPRHCQHKIQQALGKWAITKHRPLAENPIDQAIVQFLTNRNTPFSPAEIARALGWHKSTVSRHLLDLTNQVVVIPVNSLAKRKTRYILNTSYTTSVDAKKN